jgi:hypothetical protein
VDAYDGNHEDEHGEEPQFLGPANVLERANAVADVGWVSSLPRPGPLVAWTGGPGPGLFEVG